MRAILEAILLGVIQGLTEFLPVSSSGHLELAKAWISEDIEPDLFYSVLLHLATVCAIGVVFRKDLAALITGGLRFRNQPLLNAARKQWLLIGVSTIPVLVAYLLWSNEIKALFEGNIPLVGVMLLATAGLLLAARMAPGGAREITIAIALLIGISQAIAILPGISRSGATIVTALLLGVGREQAARFSFLMVMIPVLGATVFELKDALELGQTSMPIIPMIAGFLAAFVIGLLACRFMLALVRRGSLPWFAIYCGAMGILALALS